VKLDQIDEAIASSGEELPPDTLEWLKSLPQVKIITGAAKALETDAGDLILHCTASSTIEDLHGDTMDEDCVRDMARQAKGHGGLPALKIFLNHKYSVPEDVFGQVIASQTISRGNDAETGMPVWDMDLDIKLAKSQERVMKTWQLIKDDGITLGVSIGGYILNYSFKDEDAGFWGGLVIHKMFLAETSIVGIPANQRSWVQNGVLSIGKSLGLPERDLRKWVDGKVSTDRLPDDIVRIGKEATPMKPKIERTVEQKLDADDTPEGESTTEKTTLGEDAENTDVTNDATEASADPEAAPVQESTAEAPESETESDGETTADADLTGEDAALALSLKDGKTPAIELVLAALEKRTEQVKALIAEKAQLEADVKAAREERDTAKKDLSDAAAIVEIVARAPLGRKTQFAAPVNDFVSKFGGMYDEGFLKLLSEERD
jgi:hypothetical protein